MNGFSEIVGLLTPNDQFRMVSKCETTSRPSKNAVLSNNQLSIGCVVEACISKIVGLFTRNDNFRKISVTLFVNIITIITATIIFYYHNIILNVSTSFLIIENTTTVLFHHTNGNVENVKVS